ncbi:MAG: hypothetical protein AAFR39_11730 [Pseudomonadota bacterium]
MEPITLKAIWHALEGNINGVLIVEIETGRTRFVTEHSLGVGHLARCGKRALKSARSFEDQLGGKRYFFKPIISER